MEELDQLKNKYVWARGAIDALGENLSIIALYNDLNDKKYKLMRNGIIHSYVMLLYTFWKFLRLYLDVVHNVTVEAVPKKIFIAAVDCDIIQREEVHLFFHMVDDCNYAFHVYHEVVAQEIIGRFPAYHQVLHKIMHEEIKMPQTIE